VNDDDQQPTRRAVLMAGAGLVASAGVAACTRDGDPQRAAEPAQPSPTGAAPATTLAPTPECTDGDDVTPAQTEGPYFKPDSPERADLRSGVPGTRLVLSGAALTTRCEPVARALLDFWQADDAGDYDNSGFRLRGHVFTDAEGRYRIETVVPGVYPGRTRHIHVKAQAPGGPVLTTQLYFPGEPQNARDRIFSEELLITVQDVPDGKTGEFTFVLAG
jgi:protocatechuate 3,4-dioxygenase beta subunit